MAVISLGVTCVLFSCSPKRLGIWRIEISPVLFPKHHLELDLSFLRRNRGICGELNFLNLFVLEGNSIRLN